MTSRRCLTAAAGVLAAGALVAGCGGTPGQTGASAAPSTSASGGPGSTPTPPASVTPVPSAAASTPAASTPAGSPTTTPSADPGTLPQTRARPSGTDPAFLARMDLFWRAVTTGDPTVARPSFFPLAAYRQVKAIDDPDGDWTNRLIALFDDDIRVLHKRVGAGATLLGVDVPDEAAQWIEPGVEYNKGSYWRVFGTRVRYRTAAGRVGSFGISSLISWRGPWYIVHLGPINRPNQGGAITE